MQRMFLIREENGIPTSTAQDAAPAGSVLPSEASPMPITDDQRQAVYRMPTIYPGHPCLVAMQIMCAFDRYSDAAQRTEKGWKAALSSNRVRGAGGAVNQAMEILRKMHDEGATAEEAFSFGCMLWQRSRESDHPDALEPGNEAADQMHSEFVSMASSWIALSISPETAQDASGSMI